MKKKCTAIVLAAGQGKRMGAAVQKQYIELEEKPVIAYTLEQFNASRIIDDIVLVVGEDQKEYVQKEIVDRYGYDKVSAIIPGGKERYHSVWEGLKCLSKKEESLEKELQTAYVFIHDGARMFTDEEILERGFSTVERTGACVAGMPSKDTVKIVDENHQVVDTPDRKSVWTIQTPQIFRKDLIVEAYKKYMRNENVFVTDDAMVVELMMDWSVEMFEGSYKNIKLTTPEDLDIARIFLNKEKVQKN